MTAANVLPAGVCLPPMPTGNEAPTPPAARMARKRPRRGSRKKSDRFDTMNPFMDVHARTMRPSTALVWVCVWRDVDARRGGVARTAVSDIARRLGISPRTVKRALAVLIKGGFLEQVIRGGIGRGPSTYRVKVG